MGLEVAFSRHGDLMATEDAQVHRIMLFAQVAVHMLTVVMMLRVQNLLSHDIYSKKVKSSNIEIQSKKRQVSQPMQRLLNNSTKLEFRSGNYHAVLKAPGPRRSTQHSSAHSVFMENKQQRAPRSA